MPHLSRSVQENQSFEATRSQAYRRAALQVPEVRQVRDIDFLAFESLILDGSKDFIFFLNQ